MSESAPRFVTCRCQHCDKGIEFDATELMPENNFVSCPHCGRETVLSPPQAEIPRHTQQQNTGLNPELWRDLPRSDDSESVPYEFHGSATPKQVAYLTFMGVKNAKSLTKQEAHDLIESNRFFAEPESLAEYERQRVYQASWQTKRLILHPDIYASELKDYLHQILPEELHTYVRGQIAGASERLTKPKILEVVSALTNEDARWWHRGDHQNIFFERLKVMYPGCCDGRIPERQAMAPQSHLTDDAENSPLPPARSPTKHSKTGRGRSGCLVVLSVILILVVFVFVILTF